MTSSLTIHNMLLSAANSAYLVLGKQLPRIMWNICGYVNQIIPSTFTSEETLQSFNHSTTYFFFRNCRFIPFFPSCYIPVNIIYIRLLDCRFGEMIRSVGLCNIDCFRPSATGWRRGRRGQFTYRDCNTIFLYIFDIILGVWDSFPRCSEKHQELIDRGRLCTDTLVFWSVGINDVCLYRLHCLVVYAAKKTRTVCRMFLL